MSFEIVKITNNNRNSSKTQTRNGILFHVKMTSETNEEKYAEYGIEKILRSSVTLRCAKNRACTARISASHKMDTTEIKMSGKNKVFDFAPEVTSEQLKCSSNWSLFHRLGPRCQVNSGFCQHLLHNADCTYDVSRDLSRRVRTDCVQLKYTLIAPSFTQIENSIESIYHIHRTLDGKERPAKYLSENGINMDQTRKSLWYHRPEKTVSDSLVLTDELKLLPITSDFTDYWTFEFDDFIINCLPSELSRLQGQTWQVNRTFKCFSRVQNYVQMVIVSITYESADLTKSFGYPLVFASMKSKSQLDYEAVFRALNQISLVYNNEILIPAAISCDYELAIIQCFKTLYPGICILLCWFHYTQNQNPRLVKIFGKHFKQDPIGSYVAKMVSAAIFIDWSQQLIEEFFDHMDVLSLEIESEAKRVEYYSYLDYLKTYYFSNHQWTHVGNNFANLSTQGVRNFTNNGSEAINRVFKAEFKTAPNTINNVLLRVKKFKKKYILKKEDKLGADRMRARPAAQIRRAERRENLIRTFHQLEPEQKLIQLLDTMKAIGYA